ncbi:MAG: hypothetical protein ABI477_19970 [Chryseolinea sp.]
MKTARIKFRRWIAAVVALAAVHISFAQSLMDSVSQDESKIVASIAPYGPEMRAAILNVSQYPQALVKLERTQARTSQSFQDQIAPYTRTEQEKFYQISRYPELMRQFESMGKNSLEEVKTLVQDYPEGVQQPAIDIYQNHFADLMKMNLIYQSSQNAMERITAKYPSQLQDDFRKVIGSPDVMSLLTDNIDLTVSLGESYKSDPNGIVAYLDSLNLELTDQNTKDLNAYKSEVESDPKLRAEMKKAADDFSQQYDQPKTSPAYTNSNYYGSSPYPYWFGYPYWYGSPMWYPTPFYYNTGFYYGMNGGMVVFGLPSFAYANWFFGRGYYNRYPLLYRHYNNYYNVYRNNIANRNVYRGFNSVAGNHFGGRYHRGGYSSGRTRGADNRPRSSYNGSRGPYSGSRSTYNNSQGTSRGSRSSMNIGSTPTGRTRSVNNGGGTPSRTSRFSNNRFSRYSANGYHSMGWQHMSGGSRGSMGGMHGGGTGGGGMRGGRH